MSTLMNLDVLLIRSIVSPDLIINYAYTRKEEIEKHRVLLGNEQNNPSRQIDDGKIIEIDNWIKFLIDVKNGNDYAWQNGNR